MRSDARLGEEFGHRVSLGDRLVGPAERRHAGVKDDAVHDADVVLGPNGYRGIVEMGLQIIDGDAVSERGRKADFNAATGSPGRIVNVAKVPSAGFNGKGSGNACSAGKKMNKGCQRVASPGMKNRANEIGEHVRMMSAVEDV